MPKALERKLKRQAKKKGFGKKRTAAYVYGTLRKTGWTPSTQRSANHKGMMAKGKSSSKKMNKSAMPTLGTMGSMMHKRASSIRSWG